MGGVPSPLREGSGTGEAPFPDRKNIFFVLEVALCILTEMNDMCLIANRYHD